jgi:hypothetical protein
MERAAAEFGALSEATVFLDYFKDLPDPRQRGKVVYPLDEVLLLCLLAVLGGAETFVDIARFGEKKLGLLRRFGRFAMERPHTITLAIFLRRSTPGNSSAASSLGLRR